MKLVHWPLMGGLLHFVQRGGDWAGPQHAVCLLSVCLLAVPNVTAHLSTASVPITVLFCGFNVPIKGWRRNGVPHEQGLWNVCTNSKLTRECHSKSLIMTYINVVYPRFSPTSSLSTVSDNGNLSRWLVTNKNLAIANRSRVRCAHNTSRAVTLRPRNLVKSQVRSLETEPLDRSYTNYLTSYLTLNIIVTLKCGLDVTQGHWNWYRLNAWVRFPICLQ